MKSDLNLRATALIIFVVILFSGEKISKKIALYYFPPLYEGAIAFTIGSVILLIEIWRRKKFSASYFILKKSELFVYPLIGLLFFILNIIALFGIPMTLASHASVIIFTSPFFVSFFSIFGKNGELLSGAKILSSFIAFAGVTFAILGPSLEIGNIAHDILIGDLMILISAALIGFSIVCVKNIGKALNKTDSFDITFWQIVFSLPWFWVFAAMIEDFPRLQPQLSSVLGLLYHGIIITIAIMMRANLVFKYNSASVSSFFFITPIMAVFLSHLLLGEKLESSVMFGSAIVGAGIFLIYRNDYAKSQLGKSI